MKSVQRESTEILNEMLNVRVYYKKIGSFKKNPFII